MDRIWTDVARIFLELGLHEKSPAEALRELDAVPIPEEDRARFLRARARLESAAEDAKRRRDHEHAAMNALAAIIANTDLLRFAVDSLTSDDEQLLALVREAVTRAQSSSAELTHLLRERRVAGY